MPCIRSSGYIVLCAAVLWTTQGGANPPAQGETSSAENEPEPSEDLDTPPHPDPGVGMVSSAESRAEPAPTLTWNDSAARANEPSAPPPSNERVAYKPSAGRCEYFIPGGTDLSGCRTPREGAFSGGFMAFEV